MFGITTTLNLDFFKELDIVFLSDLSKNTYFYLTKNNVYLDSPEFLCEAFLNKELELCMINRIRCYRLDRNSNTFFVLERKNKNCIFLISVIENFISFQHTAKFLELF